jgi:DNA-binding NtrC family response regulator/tetratricopeptide (TPR) repeat protein
MDPLASLIGQSPGMVAIHARVRRVLSLVATARRIPPVLLRGETGTGKSLLARSLHAASPRAKGRFVSVNCAAIPETLLEAELFGYERGAFTDARQPKAGLFQEAHGGTLFLDEVGLLPESLQAKLLTALDERAVRRLGGIRTEPTDCWIVAATSADLERARKERRFREDLYHRLSVFTICLPRLRDRGGDVLRLAEALLDRVCTDYGLPPRTLDEGARCALARYGWPGNVRELGNVLERAALLSEGTLISADLLGLPGDEEAREDVSAAVDAPPPALDLRASLDDLERSKLLGALERSHWNVALAAEILGVPRNTLRYRIAKHGLMRPDGPVPRSTLRERVERHGVTAEVEGATGRRVARSASRGTSASKIPAVKPERSRAVAFLRVSLAGLPSPASVMTHDLRLIAEKPETFGGRILRHVDDQIDAAFGLEPTEDASVRAGYAALAIRRLVEHTSDLRPATKPRMAIETLNCSVVHSARGETRLAQSSLHEAQDALDALIEQSESEVVVGPGAVPYLERQFLLGRSPVQGEQRATVLIRRDSSDVGRGLSSSLKRSPFVGRTQELTFLEQRLRQVRATGRGHIVGLMGEAGIGKSRLLVEFRQLVAGHRVLTLEGQCASYAATSPYSLLSDLIRRAWRLDDLDGPTALAEALAHHLGALDLLDCRSEIAGLVGPPVERAAPLDPAVVKARIFDACRQLLLAHARPGPLVLLLEDLHWAEHTSQEFLGLLVESLPSTPILVVATTRPGYRGDWLNRSWASQLGLPPLSPDDSREIVRALRPELDTIWANAIAGRAEGNPFFLEEMAWSVDTTEGSRAGLPATIRDVLSARIDRLPAGSQCILDAASVLGRDAPRRLLEVLIDGRVTLVRDLDPLIEREFLHEHRDSRGTVYTFKHALTQEVAYDRLGPPERQRLHAVAGLEIERLYQGSLDAVLPELARHFLRAESWERAYRYLHAGALRALGASAFFEAAQLLQQALSALHELPSTPLRDQQEFQTSLELWTAYFESGQFKRIPELERQIEPLGRALGQEPQLPGLIVRRAQVLWGGARPREAVVAVAEVLQLAAPDDLRTRSYACFLAGSAYRDLGCVPEALEFFGKGTRLFETVPQDHRDASVVFPILVNIHAWQSELCAILGRHQEASAVAGQAVMLARSIANRSALVFGKAFLGHALLMRGELDQALPLLEQAFDAFAPAQYTNATFFAAVFLAYALALDGKHARALQLLDEHFRLPSSGVGPTQRTRYRAVTAAAYLTADRPDEALRELDFILPIARQAGAHGHLPTLLRLRAEALLRYSSTNLGEVQSLCHEAREMAASVGLEPEVAHCLGVLGLAQMGAGKMESGRAHLDAACATLRRLGMEYWLRRLMAEAENV